MASVTVCEIVMTHANFITLTEQMSRMAMTSVAQFAQKTAGGARSPTQTMRATSFVSIVDLFA